MIALHCWQLAGETNVCGVYSNNGSPAYYSLAPQVLKANDPQPKLVLIYRPRMGMKGLVDLST